MTQWNNHPGTYAAGITSGEGVSIELPRAGVGTRVIATAIDLIIQVVLYLLLAALIGATAPGGAAFAAFSVVALIVVFGGYPILMEWLTHGRTLGKLALGLRVVRDDGGPIGLRQALVRGISSLILEKPGLIFPIGTCVGLFTTMFSRSDKRVGDMMAGTFVIAERVADPGYAPPYWVPPQLAGWAYALDLTRLDDRLALGIRQFVTRANGFTPAAQYALGEQLRAQLQALTTPPPPPGVPTPIVLTTVLAERRRRALARPA